MAPNLKGRPRKKKPSISLRRDSLGQSSGKEASYAEGKATAKVKTDSKVVVAKPKNNGSCKKAAAEEKPKVGAGEECRADEQAFLVALYKYMKERKTPIERIPYLGFKQINLWTMFQAAQKLGGYELITARRQWKNVYDELGGNPGSTSAATCTRRHYERLILPYERHTKGEEDKPLPPVKPRKQEAGAQEGGGKTKVTAVKRPKEEQNQKPKNEKDEAVKGLELSPVPDEERSSEASERQQEALALKEERKSSGEEEEEEEEEEDEELQFTVEEEALGTAVPEKPPHRAPPWEDGPSERVLGEPPPPPPDELREEAGDELPAPKPPHRCPAEDRGQDSAAEPGVTGAVVNVEDAHNHVGTVLPTPKQRPLQAPPARDLLSEMKEVVIREEPCFGYTPVLYPRGNPGIMSPLAKKKMLSQVSGTALPNNYSFGPPPPLMNNRCANGSAEELTGGPGPQGPQGPGAETLVVNRPSVIQHAQSFKPRGTDDRKDPGEPPCAKPEHFACNPAHAPPQPHPQPSPTGDPYLLRADPHDGAERVAEKKARPSQAPGFLCDFYSSPHLHSLYRQTEHHLSKEQLTKYLSRELPFPRDGEGIQGYPPAGHPENHGLSYGAQLSQKDKAATGERSTDDQPTDLSLPKLSPHKLPGPRPSLCRAMSHSMTQQDVCTPPLFQVGNGQTSGVDYHPRACRVQPMTMSAPKKHMDPSPRAGGKLQNGRADDVMGYKVEEMSRPILSAKSGPHNVCAARPLKRSPEEPENGPPEKKIRVVTPMHSAKDAAGRTRTPEGEVMMKPAEPMHGVHVNSYAEGHKYPLHSPIFPGLYPGAFVSQVQDVCDSLGSHLPARYSHPLQYLKNQAVISPLMPPFAIHSFMMQRQLLASTAGPPHLYRHPAGASYGDFLHHGLYPMSALNPQAAFSPSQLASLHPSTKLS
ncbi:hypothetical protein SKAU_G00144710 [Synaphobranchus kaupii]|uniref:AT-rich interactive domain-containing protein 5B n=1 Tax=Synaphobranchus kaupii TaxID=118154 RepID=A0A9Q1FTW6_SYNKA|nr:hypothetical protein SKAU_G00144710 [Synaphobranchus kaupii]